MRSSARIRAPHQGASNPRLTGGAWNSGHSGGASKSVTLFFRWRVKRRDDRCGGGAAARRRCRRPACASRPGPARRRLCGPDQIWRRVPALRRASQTQTIIGSASPRSAIAAPLHRLTPLSETVRKHLAATAQRELDTLRAELDTRLSALEAALTQPDPEPFARGPRPRSRACRHRGGRVVLAAQDARSAAAGGRAGGRLRGPQAGPRIGNRHQPVAPDRSSNRRGRWSKPSGRRTHGCAPSRTTIGSCSKRDARRPRHPAASFRSWNTR